VDGGGNRNFVPARFSPRVRGRRAKANGGAGRAVSATAGSRRHANGHIGLRSDVFDLPNRARTVEAPCVLRLVNFESKCSYKCDGFATLVVELNAATASTGSVIG
jgi:hypothetical protein